MHLWHANTFIQFDSRKHFNMKCTKTAQKYITDFASGEHQHLNLNLL